MPHQLNIGFRIHFTKAEKLHRILRDGAWHSTGELARRVGHRFSSVIYQLRHSGHCIERQSHPTKMYQSQYRITNEP